MTRVLIDTSMWVEFFSKRPNVSSEVLSLLQNTIKDGDAVVIEPVRAELLSGHILPKLRADIVLALDALDMIDLDWNSRRTWDDVVSLADVAKTHRLPIPGVVDRMILIATLNANAQIASQDKALLKLAQQIKIKVWPGQLG